MPVYAMLVAWLVAVTVTPGTAAPDESATSPVTVASPVCPAAGAARMSPARAKRPTRRTILKSARIGDSLSLPAPQPPHDSDCAGVVRVLTAKGTESPLLRRKTID